MTASLLKSVLLYSSLFLLPLFAFLFQKKNTKKKKMSDFVLLNISSTISQYGSEKRFAKDLLISEFKVSEII